MDNNDIAALRRLVAGFLQDEQVRIRAEYAILQESARGHGEGFRLGIEKRGREVDTEVAGLELDRQVILAGTDEEVVATLDKLLRTYAPTRFERFAHVFAVFGTALANWGKPPTVNSVVVHWALVLLRDALKRVAREEATRAT